jgi:TonB family protein
MAERLHGGASLFEDDVFSARELASATGATLTEVSAWIEAGAIRTLPVGDGATWITADEALRAGRAIVSGTIGAMLPGRSSKDAELFDANLESSRLLRTPLAVSSGLHAGLVLAVVLAATLGLGRASAVSDAETLEPQKTRLVYLALPGPGGGGGGGGERARTPAPPAKRRGSAAVSSPIPPREEPPAPAPPEPEPPTPPEPLPPVEAPVVTVAADPQTTPGVVEEAPAAPPTRGEGEGGGAGTGKGTGLGEGDGSGIGEGSGGGTGGGPFRPGSGIEPPSLLREVKPDYSEDARRRGIEGDVVMEIVVEASGRVGNVRVLQGLGYGLDERAVAAVRQWTFQPATRRGSPVSVMVEVAMEFKLR